MERLVYEQKSHLHYLIFNFSIPGITGLKRHQKKMGRLKTRQGDARNISPYGFSPEPAQGRKEGPRAARFPRTLSERSAGVCTWQSEAAGPPDPTPQEPTPALCRLRFRGHRCGHTHQAAGVELRAQPQRRPRECLRQAYEPRVPARALTGGRDCSPGAQTHPGPYLKGQRHLRPKVPAVAVALVTAPSPVTPLIKTTTCSQASAPERRRPAARRSACWDS